MKTLTVILLVLVFSTISVLGDQVLISQSFTGNAFNDADGWVVVSGPAQVTECGGIRLFGGFGKFGARAVASKIFELPPHSLLNLSVQFWKIDSWDGEFGLIYVDDQLVWQRSFQTMDGEVSRCGQPDKSREMILNLNLNIKHTGGTAVVVFTTNLNEAPDNESWAIRDFNLIVERCPNGCSACQIGDKPENCQYWQTFSNSWGSVDPYKLSADGWSVANGSYAVTYCGGVALFGGFGQTGPKTIVSKIIPVKPHFKLKIKVLWAKIDSWDNEAAQIRVDGRLVWERKFQYSDGYFGKICGSPNFDWKTMFARTEVDVDHTGDQAKVEFTTTLDEDSKNESFGLRDLYIFYASCSENCAVCSGPKDSDCKKCANNWSLVEGKCQALPNFILLEQSFLEDKFTEINGWVLDKSKGGKQINECGGKQMVGGFDIMGAGASATKTFNIPPHQRLRLQSTIYKIDSWDGEFMIIKVDGTEVWKTQWTLQTGGANICGQGVWFDGIIGVDQIFVHQASRAQIVFTSTLDEDSSNESWGFRDFKLWYEPLEQCAIFYSECNYQGTSYKFCSKSPDFQKDNIPPQIRSIKIPPQGRVTLYENTDYNGNMVTYKSDQACIENINVPIKLSGQLQEDQVKVGQNQNGDEIVIEEVKDQPACKPYKPDIIEVEN